MKLFKLGVNVITSSKMLFSRSLDQMVFLSIDCADLAAGGIGDEGGFAPPISRPHEALELLTAAVNQAQ